MLSKTAVSQLGERRLWEEYQAFVQRDLSEYEITYLFVEVSPSECGMAPPILAAWGRHFE